MVNLALSRFVLCRASGVDGLIPLWQLQLAGPGKHHLAFKLLVVAREALLEHPDDAVRTLQDLESVMHVRCIAGGPPESGPSDPDRVGVTDWQLVIYCAGATPAAGLSFLHFILNYKIQKGWLATLPDLFVRMAPGPHTHYPGPWQATDNLGSPEPKAFGALPPRGRRHVLAQLEKEALREEEVQEEKGEESRQQQEKYILTFYGGIYHFRARFDEKQIPGAFVAKGAAGQPDYVRYLEVAYEASSMQKVILVLEDVLKGMPVYFVNMTSSDDVMAVWLGQQPSIVQAEDGDFAGRSCTSLLGVGAAADAVPVAT